MLVRNSFSRVKPSGYSYGQESADYEGDPPLAAVVIQPAAKHTGALIPSIPVLIAPRHQSHAEENRHRVELRSRKPSSPLGPDSLHNSLLHLIVEARTVEVFQLTQGEHPRCG